jgi:methylmalonyl-CoA mutase
MTQPKPLRFVTAASLFDGHDASINIMRRLLQSKGVEVIHLGHNRSAKEVVDAALMEDAHAVALSSYQGGHMEYFTYVRELLDSSGGKNIRLFGGGGGVITPPEAAELQRRGVTRIYGPAEGVSLGLNGIIDDMIARAQHNTLESLSFSTLDLTQAYALAKVITHIEDHGSLPQLVRSARTQSSQRAPVLVITGTGGAGKSSLIDELLLRMNLFYPQKKIALISVDPTKKKNQGALLGDRIRLGAAIYPQFYIRSLATRDSGHELSPGIKMVVDFLKGCAFDLVLVETSGIGQASDAITQIADQTLYVMTPEYGAQTQLEKIEMLESAHFIAVNKYEKPRAEDALRDVRKQYRRNKNLFANHPGSPSDEELPIYGTMASQFNDPGVNHLFKDIVTSLGFEKSTSLQDTPSSKVPSQKRAIIPPGRIHYLRDIADVGRSYNSQTSEKQKLLKDWEALDHLVHKTQAEELTLSPEASRQLQALKESVQNKLVNELAEIQRLDDVVTQYRAGEFQYRVREKNVSVKTQYESLSHSLISRVGVPRLNHASEKWSFLRRSNLPGFFPYASGVFPFKRTDEDPKRQFAGEGGPHRTNKRFHFLSKNENAKRLSTAFDSVTLYGEDPATRPDIYGKVGESGVSICTLQDMKDLYHGFDLTHPSTSVSMTINGPAPVILAFFMNAAMDQKLSGSERESKEKQIQVMQQVRGTVQADILKEDQAQNTCIFSLEFSLKMMGDIQAYFCQHKIKNYYTVSISGYHIAEAGANPITQLALTLSNGFTYVEYYLSRGLKIDDFADNLSFFFSNGLDPEYSVLGRVARKIWAIAMRDKYGANEKSQKLKYHIQTSGRSLHAQEIDFNDIRTTLQAFLALSDNCNSLHTNAYDEAITTPTTESVRRAMAIQMIINREFGLNKTDNPLQGSYIIEELADLVEEAVYQEFEKISDKGGVLGAMESMYQRGKIQDESLYYETLKDSGELPIIGVNTYLPETKAEWKPIELSRASAEEKNEQIQRLKDYQSRYSDRSALALLKLREVALQGGNIFEQLLETARWASLGQMTSILYEVGGKYRRNM